MQFLKQTIGPSEAHDEQAPGENKCARIKDNLKCKKITLLSGTFVSKFSMQTNRSSLCPPLSFFCYCAIEYQIDFLKLFNFHLRVFVHKYLFSDLFDIIEIDMLRNEYGGERDVSNQNYDFRLADHMETFM